jgi:ATP-binding cassette subfamily B protein
MTAPWPCVAYWNQNHFVVVIKATKNQVWIADPAAGVIKVPRNAFEKSWSNNEGQGILILMEPTPQFYREQSDLPVETARFSHLLGYVRPYTSLIGQLMAGMLIGSLLLLLFPLLTQSIVDFGIDNRNVDFIYLVLAGQFVLFFSQIAVQFLQSRILLYMGARINVAMVSDFLTKLMRLPARFFDAKHTGDLMQRIGDQTRIEYFLSHSVLPILFAFVNFIVFSGILLLYNAPIFGVFMLAAALYIMWITLFLRRRKELDYLKFQQAGDNNNTLIELIHGMQEIKLQGSERKRRLRWANVQARLFHTNLRSLNLAQWQEAGAGLINQSKNIIITFLAAKAVMEGQMTLGMMLATQYMVGQLDGPLQQFISFMRTAQYAKLSLLRIAEIQDQPDEDALTQVQGNNEAAAAPFVRHSEATGLLGTQPALSGDIVLDNLHFRYTDIAPKVLKGIDLRIPQGKVTAIVGSSGSGKTTLLKLLLGFYNPTQGKISVGNTSLAAVSPALWRSRCGAVMQEGFIFSDTIAQNIAESDEVPDAARLLQAAALARLDDFIAELPLGYATKVGAQGNGVSQGQRQRLLIARAIYKDPDYLFFDEATNALDANNERAIVENLEAWQQATHTPDRASKTIVVVAHRLSTVCRADQIVVLDKGQIVEIGTHTALTETRGFYYTLVKNQLELGA